MRNGQSTQQREATRATTTFLQLPYEIRCDIYRHVGIISSRLIRHLESWIDHKNNDHVPQMIPKQIFHTSQEVSADVLSVFWSENEFCLRDAGLIKLLSLGNPIMWSSLRALTIELHIYAPGTPKNDSNNSRHLDSWRQVCINLGVHLPPSQLTLCFKIYQHGIPQVSLKLAKSALDSMLKLPVLKKVVIEMQVDSRGPSNSRELHRNVTKMLDRLTSPRTEPRSGHFRFLDLPPKIQTMILREHTHLVAPGPVTPCKLTGYALYDCYAKGCSRVSLPRRYRTCWEKTSYDSSEICWSFPADLFQVNRHISSISAQIFFSLNKFVIDLQRVEPFPKALIWSPNNASSPRTLGHWCPEHSQFLCAFPPECIPMLRSVTWCFATGMHGYGITLSKELEIDWVHTVDFIAQNVEPLSGLTIALDLCHPHPQYRASIRRQVTSDKVMLPLRKLQGLSDLRVHDRYITHQAAQELRLERLALGEGYHPTEEEIEAKEAEIEAREAEMISLRWLYRLQ
ncbi:hypothetical protein V8E54_012725 [Elaphomyces granulatus]